MARAFVLITAFAVGSVIAWSTVSTAEPEPEVCCTVCHNGKACGDACIARDEACTAEPGCACDGEDLGVDA